jgi:hypothetical protein
MEKRTGLTATWSSFERLHARGNVEFVEERISLSALKGILGPRYREMLINRGIVDD